MKRIALVAVVVATALLAGCTPLGGLPGSGRLVTKELDLSGFTRVDAGGGFVVDMVQGEAYGVSVTTDDNIVDYLDVGTAGDTLRLGLKPGSYADVTLKARVTVPRLTGVSLSGGARGTVAGFQSTNSLTIELSGAGNLSGELKAGDTRIEQSGGSWLTLTGTGGNLSLTGSGGTRADIAGYAVQDADIRLSGGSRATVNASGRLDAELSGGSGLEYAGNPSLGRVNTSGGASISKR